MVKSPESMVEIQELAKNGFTQWQDLGDVIARYDGDLMILNYTNSAQYNNRWNFLEQVSRGLILNCRTGEIVARGFDKFFNWFENGRVSRGHMVSITEKCDGSLGILYRVGGGYRIATRGSFHSDQAEWATKFWQENYSNLVVLSEYSLLFELIYPENRVVIDYHDEQKLVLLAIRNRFTGEYLPFYPDVYEFAIENQFPIPQTHSFNNVTEIIELCGKLDSNHEGFVVEFSDGQRFKFKGDRYLELHKLILGLSFKHTLEAMASGGVDTIRSQIPEEFLGEFDGWVGEINTTVDRIKLQVDGVFLSAPKDSRKEFAVWVTKYYKDLSKYLFAMMDGRDITPMIYRLGFENRSDSKPMGEQQ